MKNSFVTWIWHVMWNEGCKNWTPGHLCDIHNDMCKEKESDPSKSLLGTYQRLFTMYVPKISSPAVSLGKKWGWTVLEIQVSCRQWEGSACTHERSNFFSSWEEGKQGFFVFALFPNVFPSCSHWVLKFSKGSQVSKVFSNAFLKMFPIAPEFYPIWFAQSSTPLYIIVKLNVTHMVSFYFTTRGPKRSFYWGHSVKHIN